MRLTTTGEVIVASGLQAFGGLPLGEFLATSASRNQGNGWNLAAGDSVLMLRGLFENVSTAPIDANDNKAVGVSVLTATTTACSVFAPIATRPGWSCWPTGPRSSWA